MINKPESSAPLFDPGHLGHFFYSVAVIIWNPADKQDRLFHSYRWVISLTSFMQLNGITFPYIVVKTIISFWQINLELLSAVILLFPEYIFLFVILWANKLYSFPDQCEDPLEKNICDAKSGNCETVVLHQIPSGKRNLPAIFAQIKVWKNVKNVKPSIKRQTIWLITVTNNFHGSTNRTLKIGLNNRYFYLASFS